MKRNYIPPNANILVFKTQNVMDVSVEDNFGYLGGLLGFEDNFGNMNNLL